MRIDIQLCEGVQALENRLVVRCLRLCSHLFGHLLSSFAYSRQPEFSLKAL